MFLLKNFFFIFFIYISPFIISYFGSVCQVFFKNFFKKIFHFSIDFWFRKWYNYYRKWKEKGENGIGVRRVLNPPKSPLIILYHKELGFVKSFWENFSKKYFKKLLTFGWKFDIIYIEKMKKENNLKSFLPKNKKISWQSVLNMI